MPAPASTAIRKQKDVLLALNWMISDGGRAANCPLEASAFVTTWVVQANQTITIPTNSDFTYNYAVDWGDDTIDTGQRDDASNTYTEAGTYTIVITGTFPQFALGGNVAARTAIRTIEQWGDIAWGSMQNSFVGAANLTIAPNAGRPDLSAVTSMRSMFQGAHNLNSPIGDWDVSNVIDMAHMFQNALAFNQPLGGWDVSSVTDTSRMFNGADRFNQDLGAWDVGSVTNMDEMFNGVTLSRENYDSLLAGWSEIDMAAGESALQNDCDFQRRQQPVLQSGSKSCPDRPPE